MSRDPRDWQKDMKMVQDAKEMFSEWEDITKQPTGTKVFDASWVTLEYWLNQVKQLKRDKTHWMCKHTAAEQNYLTQSNVIAELRERADKAEEREQLLKEAINKSLIIYRTNENAKDDMSYVLENILCNLYPLEREETTNEMDPM